VDKISNINEFKALKDAKMIGK